jgi:hypothetical protein
MFARMLPLPVLLHFIFLLHVTVVCHTALTSYFTNSANILLDVRRGPIFLPPESIVRKLQGTSFKFVEW